MSVSRDGLSDLKCPGGLVFKLRLATQAGTYVKEFVHGDFMRTRPNLREVLGGRDIDILGRYSVLSVTNHFDMCGVWKLYP